MAKIKGISFSNEYQTEYQYIMSIKDASKYVCTLIRRDLEQKNKTIKKDSR